jgi:hypothetical protein
MFQGMFAIITPALILGAIAERMRFSAWIAFITLWFLVVYCPIAHMVWSAEGLDLQGVGDRLRGRPRRAHVERILALVPRCSSARAAASARIRCRRTACRSA